MENLAHIAVDGRHQTVWEHCRNVGDIASDMLASLNLATVGRVAGYLHDMGKAKEEFQKYLLGDAHVTGSIIHTFAGVKYILENFRKSHDEDDFEDITAELIAYAIGAHHGLFDIETSGEKNGFDHRVTRDDICYEESLNNYFAENVTENDVREQMHKACLEVESFVEKRLFPSFMESTDEEIAFYFGLIERCVLSALIDADRLDTAAFMNGEPIRKKTIPVNWEFLLEKVEKRLDVLPKKSEIDRARKKISDECKSAASLGGGVWRLNVPTGGGKTLSSLRYALAHASIENKQRVIFTAPLLTIIEQNAKVIREYVQDESMILEHHSNVITKETDNAELEAMKENWDAPIIITTMVQLLDTMFSNKTSCVRRFHNLCNSIIVIDEVQTVPTKMLSLFNLMVNYLALMCGATVVLCSATQPALGEVEHPLSSQERIMVPYDKDIWKCFKRTEIVHDGYKDLEEIPELAVQLLNASENLLIVCNKKSEAAYLFREINRKGIQCYHLSAAMCQEHRFNILDSVKKNLSEHVRFVCVSTQVIEAGVDISFASVIRLTTGMDSIIQAAGRCNRNGESVTPCQVHVIDVKNENLKMLPDIQRGKNATGDLFVKYKNDPGCFDYDVSSEKAIRSYYQGLYSQLNQKATEYPLNGKQDTIFSLMSENRKMSAPDCRYYMKQAFETAGKAFSVFESDAIDVIVPYGDGKKIVENLKNIASYGKELFPSSLIKEAKRYIVSVYQYEKEALEKQQGITWLFDGAIAILDEWYYDLDVGFVLSGKSEDYLEV